MGYMSNQKVEAVGALLCLDLQERTTLRMSEIYQDGKGENYERYCAALNDPVDEDGECTGYEGDYYFAAVDCAIHQLEQGGFVTRVDNLGEMGDGTQDFSITLTPTGRSALDNYFGFAFHGVDL